jgi:hypothetical protein
MAGALFAVYYMLTEHSDHLVQIIKQVDAFTNSRSYVHQDMGACQQKPLSLPAATIG